jgi:Flp pilus assembly protein TadB
MNAILLVACIGLIAGFFMLIRLAPSEMADALFGRVLSGPKSLKDEINESANRKKKSFLRRELDEVTGILRLTGRSDTFPGLCALSLLLFMGGAAAAILLGNVFLVPVLAAGSALTPFWYVRMSKSHYKKDIASELETALSIITTAYLRGEDIQTAVSENVGYLNPPVSEVFQGFLSRIRLVDPDMEAAIFDMQEKIDSDVFREWCDALILCLRDRSLKTTLTPIVSKLSDMRVVNGELETLVFGARKEFITMQILVAGNIPLMYFLNRDWFHTLTATMAGQAVLALCAAAIFFSAAKVIHLTRPIEYRR